jgi:dihydrodiol dehydrogenase / D-xylose 1-dehydrogenase (NADP)
MIKWGVIGLGKITTTFTREFKFLENTSIHIAGSRDSAKAKAFAAEHGIPITGTYDEVVLNSEINAVYIGTPHSDHYEWAKKALLNGKHVLCEKSITLNEAQFVELRDIARSKKLMLMDAMWTYFLPATLKSKEWIAKGYLGEVKYVNSEFGYRAEYNLENRLYNPALAGGGLLDIGVYNIYATFNYLGSDYDAMHCFGELAETGVDQSVSFTFDYRSSKANNYCTIANWLRNSTFIYGPDGYIEIPLFWRSNSAILYDKDNNIVEHFNDERLCHGFKYQIDHFMECVQKNYVESPVVTHALTQKVMQTMDEIRRIIGMRYPNE